MKSVSSFCIIYFNSKNRECLEETTSLFPFKTVCTVCSSSISEGSPKGFGSQGHPCPAIVMILLMMTLVIGLKTEERNRSAAAKTDWAGYDEEEVPKEYY